MTNADIRVVLGLLVIVFGSLYFIAMFFMAGWERPPMEVSQVGYRGVGMEQVVNPRIATEKMALQQAPEPLPAVPSGGQPVSEIYQNVSVLGHLNLEEFDRLQEAMTQWVAPDQGCAYCHNENDYASDEVYTKVVTREMLKMTQALNSGWSDHNGESGVTCYTCHRGNPVPELAWSRNSGPKQAGGMAADRRGQNLASKNVGSTSLPFDPYTPFLENYGQIAVNSLNALPSGSDRTLVDAEWSYALMIHFTKSLGVNCTYCHNSRSFFDWEQSPPSRLIGQSGIGMTQEINNDYLKPLADVIPDTRKGPEGDVLKTNCATCHQGVAKPLYGMHMAKDYPGLFAPQ